MKPLLIPDIGDQLLALADSLIATRNTEALNELSKVVSGLILSQVHDSKLSLIEIGEYISEGIESLQAGNDPELVLDSQVRRMISSS